MFIIWGSRQTRKVFGSYEQARCGRCNNVVSWQLIKVTNWFTIFFIPIIPYSSRYFEQCPICSGAVSLTKEEFNQKVAAMKNPVSTVETAPERDHGHDHTGPEF